MIDLTLHEALQSIESELIHLDYESIENTLASQSSDNNDLLFVRPINRRKSKFKEIKH